MWSATEAGEVREVSLQFLPAALTCGEISVKLSESVTG